jgi:hypothetical protein
LDLENTPTNICQKVDSMYDTIRSDGNCKRWGLVGGSRSLQR